MYMKVEAEKCNIARALVGVASALPPRSDDEEEAASVS